MVRKWIFLEFLFFQDSLKVLIPSSLFWFFCPPVVLLFLLCRFLALLVRALPHMKTAKRRPKCLNCNEHFLPNYRTRLLQKHCNKPECRLARKRASQKAWLQKDTNQNYFSGALNSSRARLWQEAHPAYWKNTRRYRSRTLQDHCIEQVTAIQEVAEAIPASTLQDLCTLQTPLFVGLISMLTHSTLQDDIEVTTRNLVNKGYDILGMAPGVNIERSHEKTCPQSRASAQSPPSV